MTMEAQGRLHIIERARPAVQQVEKHLLDPKRWLASTGVRLKGRDDPGLRAKRLARFLQDIVSTGVDIVGWDWSDRGIDIDRLVGDAVEDAPDAPELIGRIINALHQHHFDPHRPVEARGRAAKARHCPG